MQSKTANPHEQQSKGIANSLPGGNDAHPAIRFEDNRPETIAQKKLQAMANNRVSPEKKPVKSNVASAKKISDHFSLKASEQSTTGAKGVIQQKINLTATHYQTRLAPAGSLTTGQFKEYIKIVLKDEMNMAKGQADNRMASVGPPPGHLPFPAPPPLPAAATAAAIAAAAAAATGEVGALAAFDAAINVAVTAAVAAEVAAAAVAPPAGAAAAYTAAMNTCITIADELVTLVNTINSHATVNHDTYGDPVAIAAEMAAPGVAPAAPAPGAFPTPADLTATAAIDGAATVNAAAALTGVPAVPPVAGAGVAMDIAAPNSHTRYGNQGGAVGYAHSNVRPSWAVAYASAAAIAAGAAARAVAAAAGATPAARNAADKNARTAHADAAAPAITWNTEALGQSQFGAALGATLLAAAGSAPRTLAFQVKQLTWDDAKEFLPRELVNLLFDAKSQLVAGAGVIDERTPFEQSRNNTTPTAPGTLRSWHEDSAGALPANGVAGAAAGAAAAVPAGATALNAHYLATSAAGAGAGAGAAVAPLGFAEYTGAGTGYIHNIKVVSDYINNRVYLTLSHYQYWAIFTTAAGATEFIPGGSQNLITATQAIEVDPIVAPAMVGLPAAAARPYVIMNPWIEVLVP